MNKSKTQTAREKVRLPEDSQTVKEKVRQSKRKLDSLRESQAVRAIAKWVDINL